MDEQEARTLRQTARSCPADLDGRRRELLRAAMGTTDLRVRWSLIEVLGRLRLGSRRRRAALDWLWERLDDPSPFTRTFALQALWDMSAGDGLLRARVQTVAERFSETGTAAMRARARRLLQANSKRGT